ncbi:MAG: 3-deoxy-manno-octulosonate cytidylyltransferase [Candidatus Omnitrophica bacterium]|nr:3-deoxy-manno-octulosonate cytidylyltransferase [Candidatus Omnitrophota bacterium]
MIKVVGVIPARLRSTRLKEKVLEPICGRPMIQHVWERAKQAEKLTDLIVACDDPRIEMCVRNFGGKAFLTRLDHPNGTSRVAEIAGRVSAEVFVNIQADEPMIHPQAINALADVFAHHAETDVATLAVRCRERADYENPNVVKVICDERGDAIYFSRSPIPFYRDGIGESFSYLKHLGIYGYRKDFLLQFVGWKPGILEGAEKLEQLRILERGFKIRVLETPYDSFSVDTLEDLRFVEQKLKNRSVHGTAKAG